MRWWEKVEIVILSVFIGGCLFVIGGSPQVLAW